jgi:hypothetical protein
MKLYTGTASNFSYHSMGIKCYLCGDLGHLAIECKEFQTAKGNMKAQAIETIVKLSASQSKKRKNRGGRTS